MQRLRSQFRLSTLLFVVLLVSAVLAVWPKPRTEIGIGNFVVFTSGECVSCKINVVTRSPVAVARACRRKAEQIRHEVSLAFRSLPPEDIRDPGLRKVKRELLARINRIVGVKAVESVLFSQYELHSVD